MTRLDALMRRCLLALLLLLAPATAPRAADTPLSLLLDVLPLPSDALRITESGLLFSYSRLDLLAGRVGPSVTPGASRLDFLLARQPLALAELGTDLPRAADWPSRAGFDLDAVDAVAVVLMGEMPPQQRIRAYAGAPRLRDAAALGAALEAGGATRSSLRDLPSWSWGEEGAVDLRRRDTAHPLQGMLGNPWRLAIVPQGLIVAGSTAMLDVAAAAATVGPALGDAGEIAALLQGMGEGEEGRQVVEALAFVALPHIADPAQSLDQPGAAPAMQDPVLAPYLAGAMAQLRLADGGRRDRVVLFYTELAAAEAAAEALRQRLQRWEGGERPIGLLGFTATVQSTRDVQGAVAVLEVVPGVDSDPFRRWLQDFYARHPIPMGVGATPGFPTRD